MDWYTFNNHQNKLTLNEIASIGNLVANCMILMNLLSRILVVWYKVFACIVLICLSHAHTNHRWHVHDLEIDFIHNVCLYLSVCLSISVCVSVSMSMCVSVCLSLYVSVGVSVPVCVTTDSLEPSDPYKTF